MNIHFNAVLQISRPNWQNNRSYLAICLSVLYGLLTQIETVYQKHNWCEFSPEQE